MKNFHAYCLLPLFALLHSCSVDQNQVDKSKISTIRKVYAISVQPESTNSIKRIQAGTPSSSNMGQLNSTSINLNVFKLKQPKIIEILNPITKGLGKGYKNPIGISIPGTKVIAGLPEIVSAQEPSVKDHNPESFASYNKLQGLKHGRITSLIEDNRGNIWLSINGGGICKYDGKSFTSYTDKQGLPNNFAWSIFEDSKGNIWFGLTRGFGKFDGKNFTFFNSDNDQAINTTTSIYEDKNGNLWFGTYVGALKYDGKKFFHYKSDNGLCNTHVKKIIQDKKGQIWFATSKQGVFRFKENTLYQYSEKENLPSSTINDVFEDKNGKIWIAPAGSGLCMLNENQILNYDSENQIFNSDILKISQDNESNLWLATNGKGAFKFDGTNLSNYSENEGLNNNDVNLVLQDHSKNLWFATNGGGFSVFNGRLFSHITTTEGLNHNFVNSITEDINGNLWLATENGISKYDGKQIFQITKENGLSSNSISNIIEGIDGKIWFTTSKGLGYIENNQIKTYSKTEGLSSSSNNYLMRDHKGNVWLANGKEILFFDGTHFNYLPKVDGLTNDLVNSIIEDKKGNFWFGTFEHGLWKYDGTHFWNYNKSSGLISNDIRTMMQDNYGNIWLGTYGDGICKFDGKDFTNYTEKEGLCNNFIYSIAQNNKGEIWFATRLGLSRLSTTNSNLLSNKRTDVRFKNFTYEDGFLGIGCNRNSIHISKGDKIYIGTNDRLSIYHPEGETIDTLSPKIELTCIELFNENIPWKNLETTKDTSFVLGNGIKVGQIQFDSVSNWYDIPTNLSLPHNINTINFKFIGITQKQSKKVKYKYLLEGVDLHWSTLSGNTSASYGNLNNGIYTFKVKAMNSEGFWSDELAYTFNIRPPWWKTWWFRLVSVALIISGFWFYLKRREKKLITEKKILERTIQERTSEVLEEKKIVEKQKHLIEEKHKEITSSINYAERIQRSFLASSKHLNENLKDYFILFLPKDIVSGDFYWSSTLNDGRFIFATADSTGHGVPGAIMSLLNITSLEKAVETETEPSAILNITRKIIIERLKKDRSIEGGKDGMDCSLCVYDSKKMKLTVSAANNPVWIIRGSINNSTPEFIEIKPDKMPVGKHDKDSFSFSQQEKDLQHGDVIYTLTDGFSDQFGGPLGRKFMSKNLRELLSKISNLSMPKQKEILEKIFKEWVCDLEQIDDITIIGVRV